MPALAVHPTSRTTTIRVLLATTALVAGITVLDWLVSDAIPLGWLYLLPMVLAARVLHRGALVGLAALCTFLAEIFDGYIWDVLSGIPRDALYFSSLASAGLFVHAILRSRRSSAMHLQQLQAEIDARHDAEEQLRILVQSSPLAVFTADAAGIVLVANDAAHRLLALEDGALVGRPVRSFLPPLVEVISRHADAPVYRTAMQCRGRRANGEIFQADVWFSTYLTGTGPRLAAVVADTSEDLRDREEASLNQLLAGSRVLVGAVSHEIRNVCGAIAVVHENMRRSGTLAASKDFQALGTLVLALERIASVELSGATDQLTSIDLASLLEEVLIIIAPSLREEEIDLHWQISPGLPPVWADRHSLLQVLLNLVRNSQRALSDERSRVLTLLTAAEGERVLLHVIDSGHGVQHPEFLFRPFQRDAEASGLGLYLSRALLRSFSGDLTYRPPKPGVRGAHFCIDLLIANPSGPSLS